MQKFVRVALILSFALSHGYRPARLFAQSLSSESNTVLNCDGAQFLTAMSDDQRDLLSRTWLRLVISETYKHWLPMIPESARPPVAEKGVAILDFTVSRDGKVSLMRIFHPSGSIALDRAAWGGVTQSKYPALPVDFTQDAVRMRFCFKYNLNPPAPVTVPSKTSPSS